MLKYREEIMQLPPYEVGGAFADEMKKYGVTRVVKLNSNEGPYPPFPEAIEAVNAAMLSLNRYPDTTYSSLRAALSEKYSVPMDCIVGGPGSSVIMRLLALTLIEKGDEAVVAWPTFPPFLTSVEMMGGVCPKVPLKNHTHDLSAMLEAVNERTKIFYICNPNNPTSTTVTKAELDDYFKRIPSSVLTVLDEAYIEYVEDENCPNGLDYLGIDKPLIIFRTFSKVYGLAGLRIGYAYATPDLADALRRAQEPFAINHLSEVAAVASLGRDDLVRERVKDNSAGLAYLHREFDKMGLPYANSRANFVFVDVMRESRAVVQRLRQQGVLVRPGGTYQSDTYLRVTVGTAEENEIFVKALQRSLES